MNSAAQRTAGRRALADLDAPLLRLPAPDRQRVLDAGALPEGAGAGGGPLLGLRAHERRGREERTFHFCPDCGSTVFYQTDPELIAVRIGNFADPTFPPPRVSVWEEGRRHPWVTPPEGAERD